MLPLWHAQDYMQSLFIDSRLAPPGPWAEWPGATADEPVTAPGDPARDLIRAPGAAMDNRRRPRRQALERALDRGLVSPGSASADQHSHGGSAASTCEDAAELQRRLLDRDILVREFTALGWTETPRSGTDGFRRTPSK